MSRKNKVVGLATIVAMAVTAAATSVVPALAQPANSAEVERIAHR